MAAVNYEYSKSPDIIVELFRNKPDSTDTPDRIPVFGTSNAIRNASPVFDRMLDPDNGFSALPTDTAFGRQLRVLSLPDDDADAMITILKIIHYQTKTLSKTISFELLVELAIVCNKYDCGSILHPWTDIWVTSLISNPKHDPYKPGHEGWLTIGYLFPAVQGVKEVVEKLSKTLSIECCDWSPDLSRFRRCNRSSVGDLSCSVDMLTGKISTVKLKFTPYPIIDYISQTSQMRKELIRKKLQEFYTELGLIEEESEKIKAPVCKDSICLELAIGCAVLSIRKFGLSIKQLSNPAVFDNVPLWICCNKLRGIIGRCKTVVPWSVSSHRVVVEGPRRVVEPHQSHHVSYRTLNTKGYITREIGDNQNVEPLQALLLKNPGDISMAPPAGTTGFSGSEKCGLAIKAKSLYDFGLTVQSSISGFKIDSKPSC